MVLVHLQSDVYCRFAAVLSNVLVFDMALSYIFVRISVMPCRFYFFFGGGGANVF